MPKNKSFMISLRTVFMILYTIPAMPLAADIIGIGVDTEQVSRFDRDWYRSPDTLANLFHPNEIAYCLAKNNNQKKAECFTARFAAKEATYKALNQYMKAISNRCVPFAFIRQHVWIRTHDDGSPELMIDWKKIQGDTYREIDQLKAHVSLSHTKQHATAFIMLEKIAHLSSSRHNNVEVFEMYYSQDDQDRFIDTQLLNKKRNGIFVDIGAHDGITYNNTYFFEQQRGWTGLCIEPHPDAFQRLIKNRKALCLPMAISYEDFLKISGPQEVIGEMWSGLSKNMSDHHLKALDRIVRKHLSPPIHNTYTTIKVITRTLNDILHDHSLTHIDLLSIDAEEAEFDILSTIDFDTIWIGVITVDVHNSPQKVIPYLQDKGFTLISHKGHDYIFKNQQSRDE